MNAGLQYPVTEPVGVHRHNAAFADLFGHDQVELSTDQLFVGKHHVDDLAGGVGILYGKSVFSSIAMIPSTVFCEQKP